MIDNALCFSLPWFFTDFWLGHLGLFSLHTLKSGSLINDGKLTYSLCTQPTFLKDLLRKKLNNISSIKIRLYFNCFLSLFFALSSFITEACLII